MENEWKKELKAGKRVEVDIQIIYDEDINKRFLVEYKVGNEPLFRKYLIIKEAIYGLI